MKNEFSLIRIHLSTKQELELIKSKYNLKTFNQAVKMVLADYKKWSSIYPLIKKIADMDKSLSYVPFDSFDISKADKLLKEIE